MEIESLLRLRPPPRPPENWITQRREKKSEFHYLIPHQVYPIAEHSLQFPQYSFDRTSFLPSPNPISFSLNPPTLQPSPPSTAAYDFSDAPTLHFPSFFFLFSFLLPPPLVTHARLSASLLSLRIKEEEEQKQPAIFSYSNSLPSLQKYVCQNRCWMFAKFRSDNHGTGYIGNITVGVGG